MSEHTPTPWHYLKRLETTAAEPEQRFRLLEPPILNDKDGGWGFRLEADAALVVTAVNCHARLRKIEDTLVWTINNCNTPDLLQAAMVFLTAGGEKSLLRLAEPALPSEVQK